MVVGVVEWVKGNPTVSKYCDRTWVDAVSVQRYYCFKCFGMASCSAWLLENLLSNFSFLFSYHLASFEDHYAGTNSLVVLTSVGVRMYCSFLVAYYFVNCQSVCRVRPVLKFHAMVQFCCAIARLIFYFVSFSYLFQFDDYGGHSHQHAERLAWGGAIRLCHAYVD